MTDEELLLSRRVVTGSGCWELAGQQHRRYGQVGGRRYAHRLAYKLWVGPIPDGMLVCHRCDNPPCFNPRHLFTGDKRVNLFDAHRKGIWKPPAPKTECRRGHPLTPENVYTRPDRTTRTCRACLADAQHRYSARNAHPRQVQATCRRGHEYSSRRGKRVCVPCGNARSKAYKARVRAGASEARDRDAAERLGTALSG